MSLLNKIPDSIAIKFSKGKEKNIKIMLDAAYGALKLDNLDWEMYDGLIKIIDQSLQNYDGRFKNHLKNYYQRVKIKEYLKK